MNEFEDIKPTKFLTGLPSRLQYYILISNSVLLILLYFVPCEYGEK
jgi:hypothetical protein